MKRKLTKEQQYRRRAEYSIRAAALCFALLIVIYAAVCARSAEEVSTPAEEENIAQELPGEEPEAVPEPAVETDPLVSWNKVEGATLTHYCICVICCGKEPDHPAYGITASGREAEPYTSVAVDPLLVPLGAYVLIDYGDGDVLVGRADDTGSGINGSHFDLCVPSHEEAKQEGVKVVDIYWQTEESKFFE